MKFVAQYEYTVEVTDEEYEQIKAHWIEECDPDLDNIEQYDSDIAIMREVFQFAIENYHVGNYIGTVHNSGYNELEWTE